MKKIQLSSWWNHILPHSRKTYICNISPPIAPQFQIQSHRRTSSQIPHQSSRFLKRITNPAARPPFRALLIFPYQIKRKIKINHPLRQEYDNNPRKACYLLHLIYRTSEMLSSLSQTSINDPKDIQLETNRDNRPWKITLPMFWLFLHYHNPPPYPHQHHQLKFYSKKLSISIQPLFVWEKHT